MPPPRKADDPMIVRFMRPAAAACGLISLLGSGCSEPVNEYALRQRAIQGLKAGIRYQHNPVVRAQAIEALQSTAPEEGILWFQEALRDEHPGVRFAACMALGAMRHGPSRDLLLPLLDDPAASVQAAAIYALHRLGDTRHTSRLAAILLRHPDPAVRNNAAMVLGRLGDKGAVSLLRRAVRDDEVMLQVVEAMALLGDERAIQHLTLLAHDARGDRQILALQALGACRGAKALGAARFQFQDSTVLETRLAAARTLGLLGYRDGLKLALEQIDFDQPNPQLEGDPPANQIMRIRALAAMALGAIGDESALPKLQARLEAQDDPRVQVAAAKAILDILNAHAPALPRLAAAEGSTTPE